MSDALVSTLAFFAMMAACWFALSGAVQLQKAIERRRILRTRDRQYLAWMKDQQQRMQRGAVQQAAAERREAREAAWDDRV